MNKEILFTKINEGISIADVSKASFRLDTLFADLSARRDNQHVGSGFGGSLGILAFFLNKKHELTSNDLKLSISNDVCIWGIDFLKSFSLKEIRKEIMNHDEVSSSDSNNAIDLGQELTKINNNPIAKKFTEGCAICAAIARELDTDNKISDDTKKKFVDLFQDGNIFLTLYCVRTQIGIDRLVKYNLDETPEFASIFKKVNSSMEG